MPEQHSPRSRLSEGWLRGEDFWGDPVSNNFLRIDLLLHPFIISMTQTTPPQFNTLGDQYIVAAGGTGAWVGHDNDVAMMAENGWVFVTPYPGVRVRVNNPKQWMFWDLDTAAWQHEAFIDPTTPVQGTRYDVLMSVGYEAEPREVLLTFTPARHEAMTLPAGAPLCNARCITPPTIALVISIRRNNAQIGSLTFNPGQLEGVYNVPLDAIITDIDTLSLVMPDAVPPGFMAYNALLRMTLA